MILTGPEIEKRVAAGSIEIEPFRKDQVNPASYDLRLGKTVARYVSDRMDGDFSNTVLTNRDHLVRQMLNSKYECQVQKVYVPVDGICLEPNTLYLMHTEEIVCAHDTVPILDGKSSLARLGVSAHLTAGFGDIGFRGQYTLEVTVVHPVIVYAGMRFCQIRFHEVVGEIQKYEGNYVGETAMGPVASRSWKQFEEESK